MEERIDIEALRHLEGDASELDRIKKLLDRFNIFEAVGFTSREVEHSRLLAFLLAPRNSHGLDTSFLRAFLQTVLETPGEEGFLSPEKVRSRSLGETTVLREARTEDGRIDILLLNEPDKWAVIVENKVWTKEHHDQLERYYRSVREDYPNRHVSGIYLTPRGEVPSHERYRSLGYGTVCRILEGILEERGTSLGPDVRTFIEHYVDMVRSNILGDAEVSKLCQQMYRKHRSTLHSIMEDVQASQEKLHKLLKGLVRETPNLAYGYRETERSEDWIVFDHVKWDVPTLKVGERYHESNRLLYFVFYSDFPESLDLCLELGMGDTDARSRLFAMAHKNPIVFNEVPDALSEWNWLLRYPLLTPDQYENLPDDEREEEIRRRWTEFLEEVLPRVENALREEAWIWGSDGTKEGR